ncbi:MAG: hypothetical protein A2787_02630 [Omnitrophica WOR_2 bacterium RIFCSPHIGHO2_01_FULL_48_9]|nr:MAG: hypothetical protein A3D10_08395 [Omnitrophica WOR_2 bacterium RIFCSPHIGHO2_02_FULL_48_11]OGX30994.1 MAG: hypothetical protein A2787_02630 [Omnitrophica WOR_2 bacterium RIFCSPHIGHO2_01_FULL_48_9]
MNSAAERTKTLLAAPGRQFLLVFILLSFAVFLVWPSLRQHIVFQRQKVESKAKLVMLNMMMPASYEGLMQFVQSDRKSGSGALTPYADYYARVVEYIPQRADGYAMLGFCYYYEGQGAKAAVLYQKAIQLNPDFFWAFYNLGVIYFNQGEYAKANMLFKKALSLKPEATFKFIFSSKIYQDILRMTALSPGIIERNFKAGYANCYKLLQLSERYAGHSGVPDSHPKINLEIF